MLIMIIISLRILLLAQSAFIGEYRLGSNYGQIFRDYSNQGRHAVNGESSLTTTYDTFPTDRGAYISNSVNYILFPGNDVNSTSFNLPSTFSIILWLNTRGDDGLIFNRYKVSDTTTYMSLRRAASNSNLTFRINYNSVDSGLKSTSSSSATSRNL